LAFRRAGRDVRQSRVSNSLFGEGFHAATLVAAICHRVALDFGVCAAYVERARAGTCHRRDRARPRSITGIAVDLSTNLG